MRRALLAAALGVLVAAPALLPGAALAQAIDLSHGGPVEVTAQDGMEWRQNEQVVIANGQARAVRGDVTVTADRLVAHYRKKAGTAATSSGTTGAAPGLATAPALAPAAPAPVAADTGSNEIYRLEAVGNVHIFTATDLAVADVAVYDIDQSVLLLTGSALKITTPQQVMTARDSMEYWSAKHMAVGRGLAVVTTSDGRRVSGDTLVGYTTPPDQPGAPKPATPAPVAARPGADPLASSGKLQRVEGFGNVEVRTATEIIRAARGVYVADSGIARLAGSVHLTRGQNQLNGDEAVVNMRTGISTLTRNPGGRIQGLVVPSDTSVPGAAGAPGNVPVGTPSAPGTPSAKPPRPKP